PAWVVTVRAPEPGKPLRRLWIDAGNRFPLKIEKFHADGELQSVSEFRSIEFPRSLPESLFRRPAGAVMTHRSAGVERPARLEQVKAALGIAPAAELPSGYRL